MELFWPVREYPLVALGYVFVVLLVVAAVAPRGKRGRWKLRGCMAAVCLAVVLVPGRPPGFMPAPLMLRACAIGECAGLPLGYWLVWVLLPMALQAALVVLCVRRLRRRTAWKPRADRVRPESPRRAPPATPRSPARR